MSEQYYSRHLTRKYPGLFIILLDQSGSMMETIEGQKDLSKAHFATTAINNLIYEMIQLAKFDVSTGKRRKYAYLSVIGYNHTAYPLLSAEPVDIPYLGDYPRGNIPIVRNVKDDHTETYQQVTENRPFWIEPHASGKTNMAQAFLAAWEIAHRWLAATPEAGQSARSECFPPVIINITDAQDNGDESVLQIAQRMQQEGTQQGNLLIFNCHFTRQMGQSCSFPSSSQEVAHLDPPFAEQMYAISSIIPEPLRQKTSAEFLFNVSPGARAFIYNADTNTLAKFLRWGTIGTAIE